MYLFVEMVRFGENARIVRTFNCHIGKVKNKLDLKELILSKLPVEKHTIAA